MAGEPASGDLEVVEALRGRSPRGRGRRPGPRPRSRGGGRAWRRARSRATPASRSPAWSGAVTTRCWRRAGVVMSLASFNSVDSTITWVGVGNVNAMLVRGDPTRTSAARACSCAVESSASSCRPCPRTSCPSLPGDTLVLATDGVRPDFTRGPGAGAASPGARGAHPGAAPARAATTHWSWWPSSWGPRREAAVERPDRPSTPLPSATTSRGAPSRGCSRPIRPVGPPSRRAWASWTWRPSTTRPS